MRDFFSFSRFFKLFKEHWVRTWRTMLVLSFMFAIVLAIAFLYYELQYGYSPNKYERVQFNVFQLGFGLLAILFAFYWYYSNLNGSRRTHFLLLPATPFEKTLLAFVWSTIILVIWYNSIFYLVDLPILKWAQNYEYHQHFKPEAPFSLPYEKSSLLSPFKAGNIAAGLLVQVMILCGLLWFRKYGFVKTLLLVPLLIIGYNWFQNIFIAHWLTPESWTYESNSIRYLVNFDFTEYKEIKADGILSLLSTNYMIKEWCLIWVMVYYRIKEIEV